MRISNYCTCLLRNLYAGQEATVRIRHGTMDWFQIGKGVHQGYILSYCLFYFYAEYIIHNAGLEEAQLESRLLGEISITSDMQMTPCLWQKRRTKEPLESERGAQNSTFRRLRSWHLVPSLYDNKWGNSVRLYFLGLQNHCRW